MTQISAMIKTATAAILLSGTAVLANGTPPTKYQCWDGSIVPDPAKCPTMTPVEHKNWSEANAIAAAGAISGSTSSATGGNAAQQQAQGQRQSSRNDNRSSARTGNQTVNVDNSSRAAANAVYGGQAVYTGNPCAVGGGAGGSSVAATAGGNFTVLDKACANKQHDLQVIDRVCAYLTPTECRATIAYLQPEARAGMVAAGTIRERAPGQTVSVSRHKQGDGSFTRAMNRSVRVGRDN